MANTADTHDMAGTRLAIVTPSYLPDLHRCRLLVDSVRAFCRVPACHYLLVSGREHADFALLAGPNTRLIELEALLPDTLCRHSLRHDRRVFPTNHDISGWVLQQLAKLAFAAQASEDIVMCVDSDTFFLRPFDLSPFCNRGRTRLFRVPGFYSPEYAAWTDTADAALGIPCHSPGMARPNYIGNMITWRQAHVPALLRHIETVTARPWAEVLCATSSVSEYALYGEYIDRVVQGETGHFHDASPLCHEDWRATPMSDGELQGFFDAIRPQHIAAMISARAGIDPHRVYPLLHRFGLAPDGGGRS